MAVVLVRHARHNAADPAQSRALAMAEAYAALVAAAWAADAGTDPKALLAAIKWHPSSLMLAVLDVGFNPAAVRGDGRLFEAYLTAAGPPETVASPQTWRWPGDVDTQLPEAALAAVPLRRAGGAEPVGVLVYAVRPPEAEASMRLLSPSVAVLMGVLALLSVFAGVALLDVLLFRTWRTMARWPVTRGEQTGRLLGRQDEVGDLARAMEALCDELSASRERAADLQAAADRRLIAETERLTLKLRRAERKAWTDPLTRLGNRRLLDEKFEEVLESERRSSRDLALVMIDIDHFKKLNDTLGHQAGDELIAFIGELLRQCVREQDLAVRYGGDEFMLVLPGTSMGEARVVAERVVRLFGQRARLIPCDPKPSMSAGIATLHEHAPANAAMFIEMADRGLYRAKTSGRSQVCIESPRPSTPKRLQAAGLR